MAATAPGIFNANHAKKPRRNRLGFFPPSPPHYYPFGMGMAGTGKQGSPDHKYTYNGKEEQEEFGLHWSDYGARMYDAQLGRWHVVDPLAAEFTSWTPYHFVHNNPILMIDPDGRAASPYYDAEGNFLGVDENGFEGEIYITDQATFDEHSQNGVAKSSEIQSDENTTSIKDSDGLSLESQSKIFTDILNQMTDIDMSRLYNGKVSIWSGKVIMKNGERIGTGFNDPDRYHRHGQGDVGDQIKVTTKDGTYKSDLYTVESVQSYLGVHEYQGHGMKEYSGGQAAGGSHYKAYWSQYHHSTYDKLPAQQRSEIRSRITEYMRIENPSLFNKLKKKN